MLTWNKPLPKGENEKLVAAYQGGDVEALKTLIVHNLGFIIHAMNKSGVNADRFDERLGTAVLGMIRAATLYKAGTGASFTTYAYHAIFTFLVRGPECDSLIRVPRRSDDRSSKFEAERERARKVGTISSGLVAIQSKELSPLEAAIQNEERQRVSDLMAEAGERLGNRQWAQQYLDAKGDTKQRKKMGLAWGGPLERKMVRAKYHDAADALGHELPAA